MKMLARVRRVFAVSTKSFHCKHTSEAYTRISQGCGDVYCLTALWFPTQNIVLFPYINSIHYAVWNS